MPPRIQYSEDQIVDAAVEIVRQTGFEALNARALAKQLGCSTQPIFRQFGGMEGVKEAVLRRAGQVYNRYIAESKMRPEKPYKQAGLAYIRFAREERNLFRLLFMRNRRDEKISRVIEDDNMDYILDTITASAGLTREEAYAFHLHMWIFTHGLAVMVATGYVDFTEEEADRFLYDEYVALLGRYQNT